MALFVVDAILRALYAVPFHSTYTGVLNTFDRAGRKAAYRQTLGETHKLIRFIGCKSCKGLLTCQAACRLARPQNIHLQSRQHSGALRKTK
jgi:hypothetical protein